MMRNVKEMKAGIFDGDESNILDLTSAKINYAALLRYRCCRYNSHSVRVIYEKPTIKTLAGSIHSNWILTNSQTHVNN